MGYRERYFAAHKSNHGWYTCAHCGGKFRKQDIDVDHILPKKYGGGDGLDNLQCLCKHCNRSKQAKLKNTLQDYVSHNVRRATRFVFRWFYD